MLQTFDHVIVGVRGIWTQRPRPTRRCSGASRRGGAPIRAWARPTRCSGSRTRTWSCSIKGAGIEPDEAEVKKLADNNVSLEGARAQQLLKLVEALDEHDDVSSVWDNSDISEAEMEAAAAS